MNSKRDKLIRLLAIRKQASFKSFSSHLLILIHASKTHHHHLNHHARSHVSLYRWMIYAEVHWISVVALKMILLVKVVHSCVLYFLVFVVWLDVVGWMVNK